VSGHDRRFMMQRAVMQAGICDICTKNNSGLRSRLHHFNGLLPSGGRQAFHTHSCGLWCTKR